jgi:hypothetical protein
MKKREEMIKALSNLLSKHNLIKPDDLIALKESFDNKDDISFEDFLLKEGVVSKDDLLTILGEYYHVPTMDVVGQFFDHQLLRLFPQDVLLEQLVVPYKRDGDTLTVIAAHPHDPHLREILGKYIYHEISFMVGLAPDIIDTIHEFYDESITYQPQAIENEQMERSGPNTHPLDDDATDKIPHRVDKDVDDYERH